MALLAYQATPAYPRPQHEDWLCYQHFAPMRPGQPYRSLVNQQVPCLPGTNAGRQAHAVLQRYQQQVAARQPGALPLEQVEVFYLPALSLAGLLVYNQAHKPVLYLPAAGFCSSAAQRLTGQVLNACGVPHTVVAAAQQQVWQAGLHMPYQAIFRRPRFQDAWQVACTFP